MDCAIEDGWLADLILNYGSIMLFLLLVLGILALPIPEETLMVFSGILIGKGNLHAFPTFIAALLGSMCGITMSYMVGRTVGRFLIIKYGSWAGITEERLDKMNHWFHSYGKWTLFVGYFIPGVRHLTGVTAGMTNIEYRHFALFAYSGALVWVSTFLAIGYFFSDICVTVFETLDRNATYIISIAVGLLVGFILYKIYKRNTS